MGAATERLAVTVLVLSSHLGRAVAAEERVVVRGNSRWKGSAQVLVD